eukprot:jgi/Botrbrau1/18904/Bobra.177_2s0061.1
MQRVGHIPVVRGRDAAWGDDEDDDVREPPESQQKQPRATVPARTPVAKHVTSHITVAPLVEHRTPPSLQLLSLGILALHIEEIVDYVEDVACWLLPEEKAVLFAVAHRRGLVRGKFLEAMVEEEWRKLDVSGCSEITGEGLAVVLPRLPELRALDFSGSGVDVEALKDLAACCPHLEVLRLGGEQGSRDAARTLRSLVPTVPKTVSVGDNWEDNAEGLLEEGRLGELRELEWFGATPKAVQRLREFSPRLRINEGPYPLQPLDDSLIQTLRPLEGVRGQPDFRCPSEESVEAEEDEEPMIPVAERFRMAYESQDARIAKAIEKNRRRAARRALTRASPAEMAIRLAECGVPLFKGKR